MIGAYDGRLFVREFSGMGTARVPYYRIPFATATRRAAIPRIASAATTAAVPATGSSTTTPGTSTANSTRKAHDEKRGIRFARVVEKVYSGRRVARLRRPERAGSDTY